MAKAPERIDAAPQKKQPPKKTLVGILGLSAAAMLMTAVPHEESSRTVAATPTADGQHIQVRNISGHQYLQAYLDVIGVATACDGLTRANGHAIKLGDRFTEAQCSAMLEAELVDSASHVMACTPGLEGHDGPKVASALLAHNIGWPTYCKSSISRLFNAGAYRSACDRFPLYDMAGGRHLPALKARRKREQYTCITGKLPYA